MVTWGGASPPAPVMAEKRVEKKGGEKKGEKGEKGRKARSAFFSFYVWLHGQALFFLPRNFKHNSKEIFYTGKDPYNSILFYSVS